MKNNIWRDSIMLKNTPENLRLLNSIIFIMRIVREYLGILGLLRLMRNGMKRKEIMFIKNWSLCIIKPTQAWTAPKKQSRTSEPMEQMLLIFSSTSHNTIHIQKNTIYEFKQDNKNKNKNSSDKNKKINQSKCIIILTLTWVGCWIKLIMICLF